MATQPVCRSRAGRVTRRAGSALLAGLCVLAVTALLSEASSPRFFRAGTRADFLRGDLQQLSIDARGELRLGPSVDVLYESAAPFLWSMVPGPEGSVFVGTGSEGRVFRIDARGTATVFFDAPELEVHAMAPSPDGGLYVGTSPDGRVYRVDRSGTSRVFFEPGQRYIWALAMDARGNLFVATGEQAGIYRVAPDGTGARVFQPAAVHATAMAFDRDGRLIVGTESPGRVLRVDEAGRGFVLLDSPYSEIRTLRFDDGGTLYVAAVNGGPAPAPPPARVETSTSSDATSSGTPVATVTTEVTSMVVADAGASGASGTAGDGRLALGGVYRIAPDGLWDQVWESRDDTPYALAIDSEGRLVVGTGNQGKIFRLEGDPLQPTLLARASAQQVTALLRGDQDRLYAATANSGTLLRLSPTQAAEGSYQSEVLDALIVARWGAIAWRGTTPSGGRIDIRTRSGNTPTPDEGWSPWSAAYADRSGSPIVSPNARFLQWRVVMTGASESPVLTSVSAAYLQRNLRPRVQSLTVHPPGIVFQRPFSSGEPDLAGFETQTTPDRQLAVDAANQSGGGTPALGRRSYQRGLQSLIWRADDENGDDLVYTIRYRREGEAAWHTLREDLTETIFVWSTTTVPDGTYFVRIVASDEPSNAGDQALTGELVSQAFDIDNTPPEVSVVTPRVENGATVVVVDVSDGHSAVQSLEFSRDGLRWQSAFPVDGIADSRTERFEIRLEGAGIDARGISLRALDAMNNTAPAQVLPGATR